MTSLDFCKAAVQQTVKEFGRRTNEEGLRGALAWRDGPYSTGPLPDHDAAIRRHRPA